MQKFCISQVNVVTFSGGVGKWIVFLWCNVNNQKIAWVMLPKMIFLCISQGKVEKCYVKFSQDLTYKHH